MNRRKFLGIAGKSIIAAVGAPAIVRAESIMRIKPIITLDELFDIRVQARTSGSRLKEVFGRSIYETESVKLARKLRRDVISHITGIPTDKPV